jgi:hypothetical protein
MLNGERRRRNISCHPPIFLDNQQNLANRKCQHKREEKIFQNIKILPTTKNHLFPQLSKPTNAVCCHMSCNSTKINQTTNQFHTGKCKAIPLQAWTGA